MLPGCGQRTGQWDRWSPCPFRAPPPPLPLLPSPRPSQRRRERCIDQRGSMVTHQCKKTKTKTKKKPNQTNKQTKKKPTTKNKQTNKKQQQKHHDSKTKHKHFVSGLLSTPATCVPATCKVYNYKGRTCSVRDRRCS